MSSVSLVESEEGVRVHVPMTFRTRSGRRQIVVPDGMENAEDSGPDYHGTLVIAVSRAHRWKRMLDEGKYKSIRQMAARLSLPSPYVSRLIRLTLLAPELVEAILDGNEPDGMSIEKLRQPMPLVWKQQRLLLSGDAVDDWESKQRAVSEAGANVNARTVP